MDPTLFSSYLPSFAAPQPIPYAPNTLNSAMGAMPGMQHPLQQQRGGMFGGGMSPAMLFGLGGMMPQHSGMGIAPLFGLAGMGLHALKVF